MTITYRLPDGEEIILSSSESKDEEETYENEDNMENGEDGSDNNRQTPQRRRATTPLDSSLQLDQDQLEGMEDMMLSRPKNTRTAYDKRQQEFVNWMRRNQFRDGTTVTAEKILSFIKRCIVGRPDKKKPGRTVGYSTVRLYGAACTDLYKKQFNARQNSNPHPKNSQPLAELFKQVKSKEHQQRRSNYEDRGIGTIQDGYYYFIACLN